MFVIQLAVRSSSLQRTTDTYAHCDIEFQLYYTHVQGENKTLCIYIRLSCDFFKALKVSYSRIENHKSLNGEHTILTYSIVTHCYVLLFDYAVP